MSFNLFGTSSSKDIRVGYIDPERGYVKGVTIAEANRYAALNPGHTFILETRDSTKYLSINEVNALTPADILPESSAATGTCGGVEGLRPDDISLSEGEIPVSGGVPPSSSAFIRANPARIKITGGGGVGAVANPIFGRDGSLLAVDLVRGGFGYKYTPIVTLKDIRGRGSGAILKAVVGTSASVTQYYDLEEDFEEYIFGPELPGYGDTFDENGNKIGIWDPTLYASLERDPIGQQIKEFQEFLAQGVSPFWSTRKEKPLNVSFRDKTSRVVHNVEHPTWDPDFMNAYAISPVPDSNVPGSDYAGRVCTFEWEEDFPFDGTYLFEALCDNTCQVYIDNDQIMDFGGFNGPREQVNQFIKEGVHQIKIDLLNVPVKQKASDPKPPPKTNETQNELTISYRGLSSNNKKLDVSSSKTSINLKDDKGTDTNGVLSIKSSTTEDAKFSDDGRKILYKGSGSITIEYQWDDDPDNAGVAVDKIEIGGKVINPTYRATNGNGKDSITIEVTESNTKIPSGSSTNNTKSGTVFDTTSFIGKANRKLWRTNVYGRAGFLNEYGVCPFDTRKPLKDNPYGGTHRIQWDNVEVLNDGNYNIEVAVDDSVNLTIVESSSTGGTGGDPVVISKNGFSGESSKSTGTSSYTRFLRKGKHKIIADLVQAEGGRFSFDPASGSNKSTISARFRRNGNDYEMVVDGSGTADIDFSLRMNDKSSTKGDSLASVRIGKGEKDSIVLQRSREGSGYKEKETITGTARFEAGRTYPVIVSGQSRTSGIELGTSNTLRFDDDIDNGFDLNGELKINRIKNIKPAEVKGINPMALAIRIASEELQVEVQSSLSWQQNPMGVALTIDSPIPDPPQEPVPVSEGRCPNNPIWTTRFPNANERWYPVNDSRWSSFTNRFALSPLPPRIEPGTDGPNLTYVNSWEVNLPYRGYYGVKGTADNQGRVLIDGTPVYQLEGFKSTSPSTKKVLLAEGAHTITVEVLNYDGNTTKTIRKTVFNTKDWGSSPPPNDTSEGELLISYRGLSSNNKTLNVKGNVIKLKDDKGTDTNGTLTIKSSTNDATFSSDGKKILYKGSGNITVEYQWDDDPDNAGVAVDKIEIGGQVINPTYRATDGNGKDSITITTTGSASGADAKGSTTKQGVTYQGPPIFSYTDGRWGPWMNKHSISPYLPPLDAENPEIVKDQTFIWRNVNFFENGNYLIEMLSDNIAELFIGDTRVRESRAFVGDPRITTVNLSKGFYDVRVVLQNIPTTRDIFYENPSGIALKISKDVDIASNTGSWQQNPIAASAILIPPPCPKVIEGRGIVVDIIADEPGQGYPQPPPSDVGSTYPVTLQLVGVVPTTKGINYGSNDLVLVNGIPLGPPVLGPFGTVESIPVPTPETNRTSETGGGFPLYGYTEYPNITMPSNTGVGFRARPIFKPVIIPEDFIPEENILQVTDLVGLKQTGYVNGKPYYGQVFFKEGVRYAGVFETVGELIQVYDTLQESIDAEVTTAPSAILRQGTDVTSNDPRLNIPGTPDSLI